MKKSNIMRMLSESLEWLDEALRKDKIYTRKKKLELLSEMRDQRPSYPESTWSIADHAQNNFYLSLHAWSKMDQLRRAILDLEEANRKGVGNVTYNQLLDVAENAFLAGVAMTQYLDALPYTLAKLRPKVRAVKASRTRSQKQDAGIRALTRFVEDKGEPPPKKRGGPNRDRTDYRAQFNNFLGRDISPDTFDRWEKRVLSDMQSRK